MGPDYVVLLEILDAGIQNAGTTGWQHPGVKEHQMPSGKNCKTNQDLEDISFTPPLKLTLKSFEGDNHCWVWDKMF